MADGAVPKRLEDLDGNTVHNFQTPWQAWFRAGTVRGNTGARSTVTTPRVGAFGPAYAGRTLASSVIVVEYWVPPGASHEGYLSTLEGEYDLFNEELWLVMEEDGTEKRTRVVAEGIAPSDKMGGNRRGHFLGTLTRLGADWQSSASPTVTADTWTTTPDTTAVNNAGKATSRYHTITLTPTAGKPATAGQRFVWYVTPLWKKPWGIVNWPMDVASGGFPHATEVTATRSLASGLDIQVYERGIRKSRWLSGANTNGIKVWANVNMRPARSWEYSGTGTLSAGATSMTVKDDLDTMPATPFVAIWDEGGTNEVVYVTGYDRVARTLTIARGKRGTTASTHASGTKLWWVSNPIDIVYGYTSAPTTFADYVRSDQKPMFSLSASTNALHDWTEYQETEEAADTQRRLPRTGGWRSVDYITRSESDKFINYIPRTGANLTTDADPATALGLAYRHDGAFTGHPLQTAWEFTAPVGITDLELTYDLNVYRPTTYPYSGSHAREAEATVATIDRDGNDTVEATYQNTTGSPTTGTADTLTFATPVYAIQLRIKPWERHEFGGISPQEPDDGRGVRFYNLSVAYDPDIVPSFMLAGAKADIYQFGTPDVPATLADARPSSRKNTLQLRGVYVPLNTALTIDCEAGTVLDADGFGWQHVVAGQYPLLPTGTNSLTWTETGLGGGASITVSVSHRNAWL